MTFSLRSADRKSVVVNAGRLHARLEGTEARDRSREGTVDNYTFALMCM